MSAQLDLFTTCGGPGFYTVRYEHAMGGGGYCRWFDSELEAQAEMQRMIDRATARGDRKVTGSVRLHDSPPTFALDRKAVWIAAARGAQLTTLDGWRYWLDGKRIHPSEIRELAARLVQSNPERKTTT